MAIQILPRTPGFRERFGEGLNTGLSSGLQALAQQKLQDYSQKQTFRRTMEGLKVIDPTLSDERAQALAGMDPQILKEYIKQRLTPPGPTKEQQAEIVKRTLPELKELGKKAEVARIAIPLLKRRNELDRTGNVRQGWWGGLNQTDEGEEYKNIGEQLEKLGIKGIATPKQGVNARLKTDKALIRELGKDEHREDTAGRLIAENNNQIPVNLMSSIKRETAADEEQQQLQQPQQQEQILAQQPQAQQAMQAQPDQQQAAPGILSDVPRIAGSGLANIMGGLGDIASLPVNLLSKITSGATPAYEDIKGYPLPPTTQEITEKAESYLGKEALEAKTRIGSAIQGFTDMATGLLSPGGWLKGLGVAAKGLNPIAKALKMGNNIPKYLKTAEKFLKVAPKAAATVAGVGTATKEALKAGGASEQVQEAGKVVSSLLAAGLTNKIAMRSGSKAGKDVSKIIEGLPAGKEGALLKKSWDSLKEVKDNLKTAKSAKDIKSLKTIIGHTQTRFDKLASKFPVLKKALEKEKDFEKIANVSSSIHKFSKKNLTSVKGALGLSAFLRYFGLTRAKLIAPVLPAAALAGEIEKGIKMAKLSPAFMKQYGDILKAGLFSAAQTVSKEGSKKEKITE